jgi:hypothetical protein
MAHQLGEHVTQPRVALTAGVLQRRRALLGEHLVEHVADHVEGERGRERHPAGQADHLRSRRDGEQRPDLRGGHRSGPARIAVAEGVVGTHGR